MAAVEVALHADMRSRLDLQAAALFDGVELIGERTLDLARRRVVPLDQVGIMDKFGKAAGSAPRGARADLFSGPVKTLT